MSYDPLDEARDKMYEAISEELYPQHKEQAITEFTTERLQSYYVENSMVMRPAVDAIQEGNRLQKDGHSGAAVVYFVTAIELLLKATLLKPVVHGIVLSAGLAEVFVQHSLSQPGFDRYSRLLARLFEEIVEIDINSVRRHDELKPLLSECTNIQALRNKIIHQGACATPEEAENARLVAVAVYELIVCPMLGKLNLMVVQRGEILLRRA